jgi:sugar phosphate isomerase/epimerase
MLISINTGLYSARPGKPRYDICDAMDFYAEAGFEAVDVNLTAVVYQDPYDHEPALDGDWRATMEKLKKRIDANGLVVSHTHIPFRYKDRPGENFYEDPMMLRSIEASGLLGAPYAVFHPFYDREAGIFIEKTLDVYAPMAEAAKQIGVTLALENMPAGSLDDLITIADQLNCVFCWDSGHANLAGHSQAESIRKLGSRLKVLHLHDNYGITDNHNSPYFGNIDWEEIVSALKEIGYEGTFNYEVSCPKFPEGVRMDHARYLVTTAKLLLGR